MKWSHLIAMMIPAAALTSLAGCSAAPAEETTDLAAVASEVTTCPALTATQQQQHSAATLAFHLMRLAAKTGGAVAPVYANTILASQRYKIRSSGTGIEFRSTDKLYSYVTSEMKALLEFYQEDAAVAKFLSDGQKAAYKTNGQWFPSFNAVAALANYKFPGPLTTHIADLTSSNDSHNATVTGTDDCGKEKILIKETVQKSSAFSPLQKRQITNAAGLGVTTPIGDWLTTPPAEYNKSTGTNVPSTPFNGPSTNPYLIISLTTKGVTTNWSTYDWSSDSCWAYSPNWQCTGYIEIDPIPYTEPAAYYNATGLVGTQANPFQLDSTTLYAVPAHQGQWARRTVNGVAESGTFSTAVTKLGITLYKYVKK